MADNSDEKKQKIITALLHTTRAISGLPDLQVFMENDESLPSARTNQSSKPMLSLPPFPSRGDAEKILAYQSLANREAFLLRYRGHGDEELNKNFEVSSPVISNIIKPLDVAWTEVCGKKDFKGTVDGFDVLRQQEVNNLVEETSEYNNLQQVGSILSTALRLEMGEKLVPAEKTLLKQYQSIVTPEVKEWLQSAARHIASPSDRTRLYQELLDILNLSSTEEDSPSDADGEDDKQQDEEHSGAPSEVKSSGHEIGETDAQKEDVEGREQSAPEVQMEESGEHADGTQARRGHRPEFGQESQNYHIFTTKYDKIIKAERLLSVSEHERLQLRYKKVTSGTKSMVGKMAIKLQQLLLAQSDLDWQFDKEEGVLDPKKLPQIIVSSDPYPFRQPKLKPERDTIVTLLLDNSGSMRGRPIEMTALSADILTRTLERCGVKTEVLGFTTQTWKGGQSRLDWISAGTPENPGRLNDNLLIIYKDADKNYQTARGAFPVMLADDLLKENIDGESLLWAYERLIKRPEKRKILLVISDGAPVDYATDKYNPANFLDKHLRTIVRGIEKQKRVELLAIGIGHDVRRYYQNAVTIQNPSALSETLVDRMVKLFSQRPDDTPKKQAV